MAIIKIPLQSQPLIWKLFFSKGNQQKIFKRSGRRISQRAAKRIRISKQANARPLIPNAPSTVAAKGFNKPLFETGRMQRGYFGKASPVGLLIKNKQEYAAQHQFGFLTSEGLPVPPRPVLDAEVDQKVVLEEQNKEFLRILNRIPKTIRKVIPNL
jgi:phage gpG-like protein